MKRARAGVAALVLMAALAVVIPASAGGPPDGTGNDTSAYWTAARMAAATPRDLVLDERGLAYLRGRDGSLEPHGHNTGQLFASPASASRPSPAGKPGGGGGGGGGGDAFGPEISALDPADGATIGGTHTFKATVTDSSGVRSVSFVVTYPNGTQTQSFSASGNGDVWSVSLQGFTEGAWQWHVVAKDNAKRGGNTTTSDPVAFIVEISGGEPGDPGGGGGGGGDVVTNAAWRGGGAVQTAAGRIYFYMPDNPAKTRWVGYVCSGTVVTDSASGRSVILTAAHCVYDDVYKAFAQNVLFIPNQAGTSAAGTDRTCSNDPIGCWSPSFGVVDSDWSSRTFPANIPWDYGFYVVSDSGAHSPGINATTSDALDAAAGSLIVQASAPTLGAFTHALGYSYSDDPNFMYCAEGLARETSYGDWWLGKCGLSGGASGGPWMQPVSGGGGPIISVNSWGYQGKPGMAGPNLATPSAGCVFNAAKTTLFESFDPTDPGVIRDC